jgi:hypothetical protein
MLFRVQLSIFMSINKALAKWTIGKTTKDGYDCLLLSINSFKKFYDVEVAICFNCNKKELPVELKKFNLIDQKKHLQIGPEPRGVAWKLYPPRLDVSNHEISIDNDIVFNKRIKQIDQFFSSNSTLLLEDKGRTYGRFENHVPPNFNINSGIFGMPPNFNLESFVLFYAGEEKNALYEHDKNETFDEQGLIALALLSNKDYIIIPNNIITDCQYSVIEGLGYHFIGLNRTKHHGPFRLYKSLQKKLYL